MILPAVSGLELAYFSALRDYFIEKKEEPLQRAYELGRAALEAGMGVLDIAAMHAAAFSRILNDVTDHTDLVRLTQQSSTFLTEALSRADMFVRGFQDAVKELEASHQRLRVSERLVTIGTMSAGLGHDIGNLLLPVRVRMQSLEHADLPAQAREDLQAIRTCVEHLQHMANGLRLLSLNPDEQPTTDESISLPVWWTQVSRMFRNALPRGVSLQHDFPETLPRVRLANHLLTQAVFNLVQNAGDVMPQHDGGEVRVSGHSHLDDSSVLVRVSDNGPGMTPEVKARCLEPFFTTKTRSISTGLGLALVHSIVQKAGGRIEIDSTPGHGATFTLHLPAATDAAPGAIAGRRPRWRAVVALKDRRINAYVKSVLESLDAEVKGMDSLAEPASRLWVTDADTIAMKQAQQFIDGHEQRRVVLLGPGQASVAIERVVAAPELTNLSAIRQILKEAALACSA